MHCRGTLALESMQTFVTNPLKGAVYGKCIAANYQNVKKDMCAKEFMLLKDCYLVSYTKYSLPTNTDCVCRELRERRNEHHPRFQFGDLGQIST